MIGDGLSDSPTHDRAAYRAALAEYLDTFESLALNVQVWTPHHLWVAGFYLRSSRLLRSGLALIAGEGPNDGVAVLARVAYESVIEGVWLYADASRLDVVTRELTRQMRAINGEVFGSERPPNVDEVVARIEELAPPDRWPTVVVMAKDVADWAATAPSVIIPRTPTGEPVAMPILLSEPYSGSYTAIYRHLSTYGVHGAGAVMELVDTGDLRLVREPADPPHVEPTDVLVLVGSVLADATTRLVGPALGDGAFGWEERRLTLGVATRAILGDDPGEWQACVDRTAERESPPA